ncbi:MAG TPA: CHRD domain-containing protein [Phycisphaerales bacterium]|nr:CHRD domain-containing protein [Phycisphaerales bacterium]HRQ75901.1 CHRD domain-containing protein [Phycisphaerales bacterium]
MAQIATHALRCATAAAMTALACSAAAHADVYTLVAELRGGQEVPPVSTTARGSGRFIVDTDAKTVTYYINFRGLSSTETAAHIHGVADPGVNAGIKHNLGTGNPKAGVWNYNPADEADILAGRMYVNVHTTNFPGGEIRGQISHFAMAMDGGQENPAVATSGSGWGTFRIDTCAKQLHYYIVVESLSANETAAHIHGLALPGANAGILHDLGTGNLKVGTWNYPPEMEQAILNGQTYVNVHTTAFPGGEIRGQVIRTIVPIDGAQEVPPVPSAGGGTGFIAFNPATNQLGYYIFFSNLTSGETAAHIHGYSAPGANSGIVHNLGVGSPKKGSWTYGVANATNVMNGLTYINVHTTNFPGGEIRGQIFPAPLTECPPAPPCPADLNNSGSVDVQDLLILLGAWGPCGKGECPADLNNSESVDVQDLLILLGAWGPCPR